MRGAINELPRILLPRTSVNKGKRERRGLLGTLEALGALEDWRAFLACAALGRTNRALQLFLYRREN
jgi:hypothetical protein